MSESGTAAPPRTVPAALRTAAERFGDRPAIVDGATTLSFARLLDEVREAASRCAGLGVSPSDRVAVWAPNTWRWEVAALAVTYAGGTLVPLNTRYTGHEVVDVLARVDARLVVVEDGFLGRSQVEELGAAADEAGVALPGVVRLHTGGDDVADWPEATTDVSAEEIEARADRVSPDDVADILFTSGTTGRSKGACTAHRQTVEAARIWGELGELSDEDRYLVV